MKLKKHLREKIKEPLPLKDPSTYKSEKKPERSLFQKYFTSTFTSNILSKVRKIRPRPMMASACLTAAYTLFISAPAHAIAGGSAASLPWVVQAHKEIREGNNIHTRTCSGSAIDSWLVITAKHCEVDMVTFPNGKTVAVSEAHDVPGAADIKFLLLREEVTLEKYPILSANIRKNGIMYPSGTWGAAYGYGAGRGGPQKRLTAIVEDRGLLPIESTVDLFYMSSIHGEFEPGDSGGPLLINGQLAGVIARFDQDADDGHTILVFHAISNAIDTLHQLERKHHRELRSLDNQGTIFPDIANVDVKNGKFSVTMSSSLLNSGKNVFFWVNGNYIGNVQNDISYYCAKTNIQGGSIVTPLYNVRDGDLIQIGIANGPINPQGSDLLYEKRVNGIESVSIKDGRVAIQMSSELFNSDKRVIIWLDGKYAAEVKSGQPYYSYLTDLGGSYQISAGPATSTTRIHIGIVPGSPGESYGKPSESQLLYHTLPFANQIVIPGTNEPSYTTRP